MGLFWGTLAALWFTLTALPTVGWQDAGELQAAAASGGVAHPTGFPVALAAARVAGLVPVGSFAFRTNAAMALFGGIAAGCLAFSVASAALRLPSPRGAGWAAAVAALSFMLAPIAHKHATSMEAYVPTVAFGAAAWAIATSAPTRQAMWGLAALGAVSAGLHVSVATAWLPALALWIYRRHREGSAVSQLRGWREPALALVVSVILAMAPLLSLLLAALAEPYRCWGYPDTLARLGEHLTAGTIREAFSGVRPTSFFARWQDLQELAAVLLRSVGSAALVAVVGLLAGARIAAGGLPAMLAAAILLDTAFAWLVNPMGTADLQNGTVTVAAVSALAGFAVAVLAGRRAWLAPLAAAFALGLGLWQVPDTWLRRGDASADAWSDGLLRASPAASTLVVQSDPAASILSERIVAEGSRPDLALVVSTQAYEPRAIRHWRVLFGRGVIPDAAMAMAEEAMRRGVLLSDAGQRRALEAIAVAAARQAPVRWELGQSAFDGPLSDWILPGAPLWSWRSGEPPPYRVEREGEAEFQRIQRWIGPVGADCRRALSDAARWSGVQMERRGDTDNATRLLWMAVRLDPSFGAAWANLGALLTRLGLAAEGLACSEKAAELSPLSYTAQRNRARGLQARGDTEQALEAAQLALEVANTEKRRKEAAELLKLLQTE
jgi:hypothetical protein